MALTARDVMKADVAVVESKMKLGELEEAFFRKRVTGFPVVDEGRIVGVVSRSDVVRKLAVERSHAGELSDYYHDIGDVGPDADRASFEAMAAEVGVRLASMTVGDVMAKSPVTVAPDQSLSEVARVLVEQRIHRIPVVESGHVVGIITAFDIARLVADERLVPA